MTSACALRAALTGITGLMAWSFLPPAFTAAPPNAPANLCIEGPNVVCAQNPVNPSGGRIKWHPGHYKFNQTHQKYGSVVPDSFYTDLAGEPDAVRGVMQPFYWAALEPTTPGNYDFSTLDQKLALLKRM